MEKPAYRTKFNGIRDPPKSGLSVELHTHTWKWQTSPHWPCSCPCHPHGKMPLSPLYFLSTLKNPLRLSWGSSLISFPQRSWAVPFCACDNPLCTSLTVHGDRDDEIRLWYWRMSLVQSLGQLVHCRCSIKCWLVNWVIRLRSISSAPLIGKIHIGFQTTKAFFKACHLRKMRGCLGKWKS